MIDPTISDQKRLSDILRLARLQLNEEFMSTHSASQSSWLNSARSAWTSTGVLLPFTSKFVYPTEEEVIARGVQIYNSLSAQTVAATSVPAPQEQQVVKEPVGAAVVSLVQAGGDFVLIEEPVADVAEPVVELEPVVEPVVEPIEEPVVELEPVVESAADSLIETKLKSLFTKWGGKGNY